MQFITSRLILRPLSINDKEAFFEYRKNTDANKYQGWIPQTLEDAEVFINKLTANYNQADTWFQLAVVETQSQKVIGDIGLHFIDEENQMELGYTIGQNHQQKGYATEALTAILNHLFFDLKKHRITASIDPANLASIRLLEKFGFRKEAHFLESYYQNGKWMDDVVYALLLREWEKR
jgi:RimJ/RimL family protein N-acetyltransferase